MTNKKSAKKVTLVKKSTGEKTEVTFVNKAKTDAPPAPKKTKASMVKSHLIKKKHITSWDAIMYYRATRLSAIIFNLRKSGYRISTNPITTKDANGNSVTYAKYILVSEPKGK